MRARAVTPPSRAVVLEPLGRWLFRRRSLLPIFLLPVVALSVAVGRPEPGGGWTWVSGVLVAIGLSLRALVIGRVPARTSVRNVHRFQAETLNVTGMYSLVRHPLYLANVVVAAGLLAALREPVGAAIGVVAVGFLYVAISSAEDAFLAARFGEAHARWRARTPAMLPTSRGWLPSPNPFSWRTVLRKEHPSWLAVPLIGLVIDGLTSWRLGNPSVSSGWIGTTGLGVVAFSLLRTLKYRTRLLHVPGR